MTPENLEEGRKLYKKIKDTKDWIDQLEREVDISISGHYRKEGDPEIWSAMRDTALAIYRRRLEELEKQFNDL